VGKIHQKFYITKLKKQKRKKKSTWCLLGREDGVGVYSLIVNPGSSSECYVAGCSCRCTYISPQRFIPAQGTFAWKSFYKLSVKMSTSYKV
jgi:hypothetical protein